MIVIALTDYRILRRLSLLLMAGTVLVLLAVLIIGTDSLGSRQPVWSVCAAQRSSQAHHHHLHRLLAQLQGVRIKAVSDGLVPFAVLLDW